MITWIFKFWQNCAVIFTWYCRYHKRMCLNSTVLSIWTNFDFVPRIEFDILPWVQFSQNYVWSVVFINRKQWFFDFFTFYSEYLINFCSVVSGNKRFLHVHEINYYFVFFCYLVYCIKFFSEGVETSISKGGHGRLHLDNGKPRSRRWCLIAVKV